MKGNWCCYEATTHLPRLQTAHPRDRALRRFPGDRRTDVVSAPLDRRLRARDAGGQSEESEASRMTATKRTPPETPILHGVYLALRQQSARTHTPRGQILRSGARLTVSVRGETITVIVAREGKPVGDVEIETFRLHCHIPPDAARAPREGQQVIEED